MTNTVILTRGLPASGKSTAAVKMIKENDFLVRLERDLLRIQLFGHCEWNKLTADDENLITQVQRAMAAAALKANKSVIISDTNLRASYVREWAKFAVEHGALFDVANFDDVSVEECIRRDAKRDYPVGEAVIHNMASKFLKNGKLQSVDVSKEMTSGLYVEPYDNPTDLPQAIIVDIDGTLAKMNGRSPYEWHRVGEDSPVEAVIDVVHAASQFDRHILIMSGRDSSCREVTEKWLTTNLRLSWDQLFMRAEGDNRKDNLVKYELFNKHIRDKYHVNYVLDDRDQVVQMWRELGLPCFQVAPGSF